jgi:CelD/BcsL family acetyltransferase involved in cellulose biosynthesis
LLAALFDPVGVCDVVIVAAGAEDLEVPRDCRLIDAPVRVTCETIRDESAFATLAGSWDALVRAMPRPSPFMLHAWLLEWWRHFGEGSELAIFLARRDNHLVGALPLFVRKRWGLRIASFLGAGESALSDLLTADASPASVAEQLMQYAAASGISALDVFGLTRESRLAAALGPARLELIERVESPVIDLGGDWEAFLTAKLSSSRRREVRRRSRNLAAEGKLEVAVARTPEEVGEALGDAFRLHGLRWGEGPDRSTFGTPRGQRFHRAALAAVAKDDLVRVSTVRLDGRAIAFQCWFALGASAYQYRIAHDPAFQRFGLGFASTLDVINAAMAEGLVRFELLGGAEGYKLEIADRLAPMHQGVGMARGPRGRAFVAARVAALRGFQRLRRSEPVRRAYYEGVGSARRAVMSLRGRHA